VPSSTAMYGPEGAAIAAAKVLIREHGIAAETVAMTRAASQADRQQIDVWNRVAAAIRGGGASIKLGE
jgi:hypothetical protein